MYVARMLVPLVAAAGAAAALAAPALPPSARNAAGFVPAGYKVLEKAAGDLNGDRVPDLALVLHPSIERSAQPDADTPRRLLVVAFGAKGGNYRRAVVDEEIIMGKDDGGVLGDPYQGIFIERGTLAIQHYGGSRDRWGYLDRFRWQNGAFEQIGHTYTSTDTLNPDYEHVRDTNLSTGLVEDRRKGVEPGEEGQKAKPPSRLRFRELWAPPLAHLPTDTAAPLNRPALRLRQRDDVARGAREWRGPEDLSATLSAAMVGTGSEAAFYLRALVQDDRVLTEDTVQYVNAKGAVVKPDAVTTKPEAGGYLWQGKYSPASLGVRRGNLLGSPEGKPLSGWGLSGEGGDYVTTVIPATVEVIDFDEAGKAHAALSTSWSGRSRPAALRFTRRPGLPRLGESASMLLYE